MRQTLRPVTETRVQRRQFQTLYKLKNGCGPLANKREDVQEQREESNGKAKEKRDAVAPPRLYKFVEAKNAPPLPKAF
jgi:hypothetical protein